MPRHQWCWCDLADSDRMSPIHQRVGSVEQGKNQHTLFVVGYRPTVVDPGSPGTPLHVGDWLAVGEDVLRDWLLLRRSRSPRCRTGRGMSSWRASSRSFM